MELYKNLQKIFILLHLLILQGVLSKDCYSNSAKKCMRKDQLGGYAMFVKGGDPCFVFHGERVSQNLF